MKPKIEPKGSPGTVLITILLCVSRKASFAGTHFISDAKPAPLLARYSGTCGRNRTGHLGVDSVISLFYVKVPSSDPPCQRTLNTSNSGIRAVAEKVEW